MTDAGLMDSLGNKRNLKHISIGGGIAALALVALVITYGRDVNEKTLESKLVKVGAVIYDHKSRTGQWPSELSDLDHAEDFVVEGGHVYYRTNTLVLTDSRGTTEIKGPLVGIIATLSSRDAANLLSFGRLGHTHATYDICLDLKDAPRYRVAYRRVERFE